MKVLVTLQQDVTTKASAENHARGATFVKNVELPLPPFIGMVYWDGYAGGGVTQIIVDDDLDHGMAVRVFLTDKEVGYPHPLTGELRGDEARFEYELIQMQNAGWERHR